MTNKQLHMLERWGKQMVEQSLSTRYDEVLLRIPRQEANVVGHSLLKYVLSHKWRTQPEVIDHKS